LISKEIINAEHDIWIFAPWIIDAGYATAKHANLFFLLKFGCYCCLGNCLIFVLYFILLSLQLVKGTVLQVNSSIYRHYQYEMLLFCSMLPFSDHPWQTWDHDIWKTYQNFHHVNGFFQQTGHQLGQAYALWYARTFVNPS
jgi:hypothetical protein